MAMMINRDAPKSGIAGLMAMKGRRGDSELVHMSPTEVDALQSMGQLSVNPDTGLPEAFGLQQMLPMIANIGLGVATGGMSLPAQMAIMAAANTGLGLAQGKEMDEALAGGVMAGATTGIGGALGGAGDAATSMGSGGADALSVGEAFGGNADALNFDFANAAGGLDDAGTIGMEAANISEAANLAGPQGVAPPPINSTMPNAGADTLGSLNQPTTLDGGFQGADAAKDSFVAKGAKGIGLDTEAMAQRPLEVGGIRTSDIGGRDISELEALNKGVKTAGASLLQSAMEPEEYDPVSEEDRPALKSTYGTRDAEFVKQNYVPEGLTAEEVQASALGQGDPLNFFEPITQTPYGVNYGGSAGVTGSPTQMGNPKVGAGYAKTGGHLEDLFYAQGGSVEMFSGLVQDNGAGDGMSDNVEFDVRGDEEISKAMLSPDEYVIDAHTVSALGNGSTNKGADRLDKFVSGVRTKSYNKGKQPKQNAGLAELAKLQS
jgi:hypothetical protein